MKLPRCTPVELDANELHSLLQIAQRAADAARPISCSYFRQPMQVENKALGSGFDPVTMADREAELAIRDVLRSMSPHIGFYGEEHEAITDGGALMWIVDPIDGTRAFMSGMPLWGTLIGLYDGERAVLGLMDQPVLDERYVGYGDEALLITSNNSVTSSLSARFVPSLQDAVAYCTTPDMFTNRAANECFLNLKKTVKLMRYGGDCYAYALLAAGFVDIVVDCDLQPYDIAALIPIIEAAGGVVSNWKGERAIDGGYVVACGSPELHAHVLPLLQFD